MASAKIHHSATQAFLEFKRCFAELSEREQGLVGVDKVLMFVRSIDQKERMLSVTTCSTSGGQKRVTSDNWLPPKEESLM